MDNQITTHILCLDEDIYCYTMDFSPNVSLFINFVTVHDQF